MARKRCATCYGSGKVMGGGMMMQDCEECNGAGKINVVEEDIEELNKIAKNTESYKSAKEKIKLVDKNLSDDEAEKILDVEFKKTNLEKK